MQFKRWFGNSVMTENGKPNGKPRVFYHGTNSGGFTVFDKNMHDSGNEFTMGTGTLKTDVLKYWYTNYKGSVDNDLIGNVKLDIRGIKDSFGHGMTEEKAAAYAAVPEIIKGGVIIDYQKKWKGKPRDTIVIAAPIVIAGEKYLAE